MSLRQHARGNGILDDQNIAWPAVADGTEADVAVPEGGTGEVLAGLQARSARQ